MLKKLFSITVILSILCTFLSFNFGFSVFADESDGFGYYIRDNKAYITTYDKSIKGDVVIPSELGGYPVEEINAFTFRRSEIESVTISENVKIIGHGAFLSCKKLKKVFLPDSLNVIGFSAFENCINLSEITLPDKGIEIKEDAFKNTAYFNDTTNYKDGFLYIGNHLIKAPETLSGEYKVDEKIKSVAAYAFKNCTELTSIVIHDGVTLGQVLFEGCTKLESVTVPYLKFSDDSHITTMFSSIIVDDDGDIYETELGIIEEYARNMPENIKNITVTGNDLDIENYTFYRCNNLLSVKYTGRVKNIGKEAFAVCTELKQVEIPECESIGDSAFDNCRNLEKISFGDKLTKIGKYAFSYCKNLKSINIPKSVTSIDSKAFEECINLKDVYYSGSKADCAKISIANGNEYLTKATIHYAIETPTQNTNSAVSKPDNTSGKNETKKPGDVNSQDTQSNTDSNSSENDTTNTIGATEENKNENQNTDNKEKDSSLWIWIIVSVLAVLIIGAAIIFLLYKKGIIFSKK